MSRVGCSRKGLLSIGLAAATMIAGHAWAVETPTSSPYDARIQYVNYKVGQVFVVRTMPGYSTRIVFAPDEHVLGVSSGFTQGWEFNAAGSVLYMKAKTVQADGGNIVPEGAGVNRWNTNLAVTTDKRMYDFDLHLLPGSNDGASPTTGRIAYMVQMRYPDIERAKAAAANQSRQVEARLSAKAPPVNWSYKMQIGKQSTAIAPTLAYDDGRFTYLRFPSNREVPSVFLVAQDKSESIVNTHVDPAAPDILVVHRVAPAMVLRLGDQVVGIYNERFDPNGVPARDGSMVPGVKRVLNAETEQ